MNRMIAPAFWMSAAYLAAVPASAASGIAIPEPSNWALFGLGVLGVLIGRFGVRTRRRDDD
ncbi:PEP-CTERM sorting domain-containing protein [Altererythrobacter sp.]|nr:PEP-CTERM sorting domain-containing protein [Altererythrobacter sp.]